MNSYDILYNTYTNSEVFCYVYIKYSVYTLFQKVYLALYYIT
jgi:hypothetical protein